jgi:hypothetical protein
MNPETRPGEVVLTGEARWLLATLLHSCDSDTAELFDFSGGCAGTVISSATCGAWGAALWDQLPNLCLIRFSSPSSPGVRAHMLIAASEAQRVGERLGTPIPDLGPRQGTRPTRAAEDRHRTRRLLRRPAQPMAARHEREHQRTAPPILPQRNRPIALGPGRDRSRRRSTQQQAPARHSTGRPPLKP